MSSDHRAYTYHLFAFSENGKALRRLLTNTLNGRVAPQAEGPLKERVKMAFQAHSEKEPQVLIFIGATGIAVRSIHPFIQSKFTDPPIIVIDDLGLNAISLLSGHYGNANAITLDLCKHLQHFGYKANPVITTATDLRGFDGFEPFIKRLHIDPEKAKPALKSVNSAIANGKPFGLFLNKRLRLGHPITWAYPYLTWLDETTYADYEDLKVAIGYEPVPADNVLSFSLISKSIVVGTGLKKQLDGVHYDKAFDAFLKENGFCHDAVKTVVSIDLKKEEPALKTLSTTYGIDTEFFEAKTLLPLESLFKGSDFVKKITGVSAVAGPSALYKTQDEEALNVTKKAGCTFSAGRIVL